MGSEPHASTTIGPGARLGRYEVVRHVASGGMGAVWLGRLEGVHGFEKSVAIKTILPGYAREERFRRMFLDEARIVSRIEHANVAQTLDLGEHEGTLYIVLEWVEGTSLERLARALAAEGRSLPLGVLLRTAADACAGLHAAHELTDKKGTPMNLVHRDVSPQNVMVSESGITKVIDFGIMKAALRTSGDTTEGKVRGKPHYMPPEQLAGCELDRRADVWAMGAVLFRLSFGHPPIQNSADALDAYVRDKVVRLPSPLPAPLAEIVTRALSFERGARYATAAEMQRALEGAIVALGAGESTAADVAAFMASRRPAAPDSAGAGTEPVASAEMREEMPTESRREAPEAAPPSTLPDGGAANTTGAVVSRTLSSRLGGTPERRLAAPSTAERPLLRKALGIAAVALAVGAAFLVGRSSLLKAREQGEGPARTAELGTPPAASPLPPGPALQPPAPPARAPEPLAVASASTSSAASAAPVAPPPAPPRRSVRAPRATNPASPPQPHMDPGAVR